MSRRYICLWMTETYRFWNECVLLFPPSTFFIYFLFFCGGGVMHVCLRAMFEYGWNLLCWTIYSFLWLCKGGFFFLVWFVGIWCGIWMLNIQLQECWIYKSNSRIVCNKEIILKHRCSVYIKLWVNVCCLIKYTIEINVRGSCVMFKQMF